MDAIFSMQFERALERVPAERAEAEAVELRALLLSPALLRALRCVRDEAASKATQLAHADLATPAGIARAQKMQGEAAGLLRAVDILVEQANAD